VYRKEALNDNNEDPLTWRACQSPLLDPLACMGEGIGYAFIMPTKEVGTPAETERSGMYGLVFCPASETEAGAGGAACGVGASTNVDICPGGCADGDRDEGPTMPL